MRLSYQKTDAVQWHKVTITFPIAQPRTAKRLAVVVAAFITCWLPFFVSYVARPFHAERLIPGGVYTFLTWLGN